MKQGNSDFKKSYIVFLLDHNFFKGMRTLEEIISRDPSKKDEIEKYLSKNYGKKYGMWYRDNLRKNTHTTVNNYHFFNDFISTQEISVAIDQYNEERFDEALDCLYNYAMKGDEKSYSLIEKRANSNDTDYIYKLAELERKNKHYKNASDLYFKLYELGDSRGFQALKKISGDKSACYKLGLINIKQNPGNLEYMRLAALKGSTEALKFYEERLNLENIENSIEYANILLYNHKIPKAITIYCSEKIKNSRITLNKLSDFYNDVKNENHKKFGSVFYGIGEIFRMYGDLNNAKICYYRALDVNFMKFGKDAMNLYDNVESLENFLNRIPNQNYIEGLLIKTVEQIDWITTGEVYKLFGKLQKSRGLYEDAIRLLSYPELSNDIESLYLKGYCNLSCGHITAAKECLERGSSLGSQDCKKVLYNMDKTIKGKTKQTPKNISAIIPSKLLHEDDERKRRKGIH